MPPEAQDFYDDIFKENKTTKEILDEDCQQYDKTKQLTQIFNFIIFYHYDFEIVQQFNENI